MKIQAHLPPQAMRHTVAADTAAAATTEPIDTESAAPPDSTPTDPVDTVELTGDGSTEAEHQPGVIRNLLAGHYRGVADVRLRIVHADRLAALSERAAADAAQAGSAALGEAVNGGVEAILGREDLTDEQRAAVEASIGAFNAALADGSTDPKAAPDSLLAELEAALTESPAEPTDETEPVDPTGAPDTEPVEAEPDAEPTLAELLAALRDAVEKVLDDAEASIASADPLPPLSEPRGRGAAYAKFLDEYLRLGGDAPTDAEPAGVEPAIDVVA